MILKRCYGDLLADHVWHNGGWVRRRDADRMGVHATEGPPVEVRVGWLLGFQPTGLQFTKARMAGVRGLLVFESFVSTFFRPTLFSFSTPNPATWKAVGAALILLLLIYQALGEGCGRGVACPAAINRKF